MVRLHPPFCQKWLFPCLLCLLGGGTLPKHLLVTFLGRNKPHEAPRTVFLLGSTLRLGCGSAAVPWDLPLPRSHHPSPPQFPKLGGKAQHPPHASDPPQGREQSHPASPGPFPRKTDHLYMPLLQKTKFCPLSPNRSQSPAALGCCSPARPGGGSLRNLRVYTLPTFPRFQVRVWKWPPVPVALSPVATRW